MQIQSKNEELPSGDAEFMGQCVAFSFEQNMFTGQSVQVPLSPAETGESMQRITRPHVVSIIQFAVHLVWSCRPPTGVLRVMSVMGMECYRSVYICLYNANLLTSYNIPVYGIVC